MQTSLKAACFSLVLAAGLTGVAHAESTGSVTPVESQTAKAGKLATHTEIMPERQEAAMITAGSLTAMEDAVAMYRDIAARGGWPTIDKAGLKRGDRSERVVMLRHRLVLEGYLGLDALTIDKPSKFDSDVEAALKLFQANHGLATTGKLDASTLRELNVPAEQRLATLEANEPRIAEYAAGLGERYILVNIPSAQLETVNFGTVYSRHNVVAGRLERPSPTVSSKISEINFNPYWNAPVSIVERDLIPKLVEDPHAMEAMHIRVYDGHDGPEIDPTSVDWTQAPPDRFFFRQDPGDGNAMASVKVNFPNKHHVYLHDTPAKDLFKRNDRFESSGCVRVEQIHVLVDWILNGQQGFDRGLIEEIASSRQRMDVTVSNPPDLRITYLTAWATEDGRIHFRPDVYGLDGTGFILGQPEAGGGYTPPLDQSDLARDS